MANTLLQLIGETVDIEDLSFGLNTSDLKIIKDGSDFFLQLPFLNHIEDTKEVILRAKEILDILNGTATLFYINHRYVKPSHLIRVDDEGRRAIIMSVEPITVRSRLRGTLTSSKSQENQGLSIYNEWLQKANKHKNVRDVLHFFSDITWWNLYKIYELIIEDSDGKNVINKHPKRKISQFTMTAQSRELLGDQARHAASKYNLSKSPAYKQPTAPFTLDKAYSLMKSVFEEWIKLKPL